MSAHNTREQLHDGLYSRTPDPGDAGTITPTRNLTVCQIETSAAETRTLGDPLEVGVVLILQLKTDGGDCTITADSAYDQAGSTTITLGDANDSIVLYSIEDGTDTYAWRVAGYDGATGPTEEIATIDADTINVDTLLDLQGVADVLVLDGDGDTTISAPTDDQIDVEVGGVDALDITRTSSDHAVINPAADTRMSHANNWNLFEDFNMQAIPGTEADWPWILNSGTDTQAVDPAIPGTAEQFGVLNLVSGDTGTGVAADGSQIVCEVPLQIDNGGVVFETRLHIDTAVTGVQLCAGLSDSTSLEMPASVGGSDAITTTATDAVVFCYDTAADTDEWFVIGVAGNTDATGNAASGTAPTADTYQTLRIEVDADGAGARFYIDGTLVGTLTANAVSASTNLFATVVVASASGDTNSVTVQCDYIDVWASRS